MKVLKLLAVLFVLLFAANKSTAQCNIQITANPGFVLYSGQGVNISYSFSTANLSPPAAPPVSATIQIDNGSVFQAEVPSGSISYLTTSVGTEDVVLRVYDANGLRCTGYQTLTYVLNTLSLSSPVGGQIYAIGDNMPVTYSGNNSTLTPNLVLYIDTVMNGVASKIILDSIPNAGTQGSIITPLNNNFWIKSASLPAQPYSIPPGMYILSRIKIGVLTGPVPVAQTNSKVRIANTNGTTTLSLNVTPDTLNAYQQTTATFSAFNGFGFTRINWGDGTLDSLWANLGSFVHTYTVPGTYNVVATNYNGTANQAVVVNPANVVPLHFIEPMGGEVYQRYYNDTLTLITTLTGNVHYTVIDAANNVIGSGDSALVSSNGNIKKFKVFWPQTSASARVIATMGDNSGAGTDTSNVFSIVERACSGTVYIDLNSNNVRDNGEPGYIAPFNVTPNNPLYVGYTQGGNYTLSGLSAGINTITPQAPPNATSSPANYILDFTTPLMYSGMDVALQPVGVGYDLDVYIARSSVVGMTATIYITVYNSGPLASPATTLTYNYNPTQVTVTGSTPYQSSTPGTRVLTVPPIAPGSNVFLRVYTLIMLPVGTVFTEDFHIPNGDLNPGNDDEVIVSTTIGGCDPNYVEVSTDTILTPGNINPGYLDYTVHFQNTGNGLAVNIKVTDTIASQLDLSTLQVLGASHTYSYIIRPGNVVDWYFYDIMLPDSSVDEPGSHGQFLYRIKPQNALPVNTVIPATANIYFDYNPAVTTNTATTKILEPLGINEHTAAQFSIYPNPASSSFNIQYNLNSNALFELLGIDGKKIDAVNLQGISGTYQYQNNTLKPGVYLYRVSNVNGVISTGKLVIIK